ncbi:SGNH/GDSL hydrolase family protein [soil metagenome]
MKKIILIGDSIRMGYEATVRAELEGFAEVWAPEPNCQHTVNVLLNFNEWIALRKPDILHIAAGGWDVRNVIRGVPGNVVPLDAYRKNVATLLSLSKQFTKEKVIWANITPIDIAQNFANHAATGHPGRTEGDIALYNAAAIEECRKAGVEVNDLFKLVTDHDPFKLRLPDGVHYTPEGYALLGRQVAGILKKYL